MRLSRLSPSKNVFDVPNSAEASASLYPIIVRSCQMSTVSCIFVGLLITVFYHPAASNENDKWVTACDKFGCSEFCTISSDEGVPQCFCGGGRVLDPKDKKTCIDPSTSCYRHQLKCNVSEVEKCISLYKRCDNISDCDNSEDEWNCEGHECPKGDDDYRCSNGACVRRKAVCDRKKDCKDGSDEKDDCDYSTVPCLNMKDHLCDNGTCVPALSICDRIVDCDDGTDEKDCAFSDSEFIFYNEGFDVYKQELIMMEGGEYDHGTYLLSLNLSKESIITGLSFAVKHRILFISDADRPAIYSVNMSSYEKKDYVTERIIYPVDIEFDWSSDNIYWVDSVKGTVEIVNMNTRIRDEIIQNLLNPIAIALSPITGTMFIATAGPDPCISTYGMDGHGKWMRSLYHVQGSPSSLALHPYKSLLYWTDTVRGEILYADYSSSSNQYSVLATGLRGIMSLTVGFNEIFYTTEDAEGKPNVRKVHRVKLGIYQKNLKWKSIASTFGVRNGGKSECLVNNGNCDDDQLCITTQERVYCRRPAVASHSFQIRRSCFGMPS